MHAQHKLSILQAYKVVFPNISTSIITASKKIKQQTYYLSIHNINYGQIKMFFFSKSPDGGDMYT
jgi:hypothetical protein